MNSKSNDTVKQIKTIAAAIGLVAIIAAVIMVPSLISPQIKMVERDIPKSELVGLSTHGED
jgi:hypothetical protein